MPTGKEISLNNFMMVMAFADQEYNRIYNTLLSAEKINPGSSTAILEDLRAQEISIRGERRDLSRIFIEGVKADADFQEAITKSKLDLDRAKATGEASLRVAGVRAEVDIQQAKIDLQEAQNKENTKQQAKGASSLVKAADRGEEQLGSIPLGAAERSPADEKAAKEQIAKRINQAFDDSLKRDYQLLSTDRERKQYLEDSKAVLKDSLETYTTVGTYGSVLTNKSVVITDEVDKYIKGQGLTGIDKRVKEEEKKQKELVEEIDKIGIDTELDKLELMDGLTVKAKALGLADAGSLKYLSAPITGPAQPIVVQAAFNAQQLPSLMDPVKDETGEVIVGLEPRYTFETKEDLQAAIDEGDEKALELYDKVLGFQASQINLLNQGEYPRRLYDNEMRAIKLENERKVTQQKILEGMKPDAAELHRKALRIWQELYGAKNPKIDFRTTAEQIRKEYEDPEVADAVRRLAETQGFNPRQIRKLSNNISRLDKVQTRAELEALHHEIKKTGQKEITDYEFQLRGEDYNILELKQIVEKANEQGEMEPTAYDAWSRSFQTIEDAIDRGVFPDRAVRQIQKTFDFLEETEQVPFDIDRDTRASPTPEEAERLPEGDGGSASVERVSDEESALAAAFATGMGSATNDPNGANSIARPAAMNAAAKGLVLSSNVAMAGKGNLKDKKMVAQKAAKKALEDQGYSKETINRAVENKAHYGQLYRLTEDQAQISMTDLSRIDPMVDKDFELASAAAFFGTIEANYPDEVEEA